MADEPNAGERIAKVLARRGVASRRAAEAIVAAGRVSVNGEVIDSPARNVTPTDRIALDGVPIAEAAPPRLWLYHKPAGLVTTERDEKGRPTVFAALPPELGRVMSVGRLDITSEGLLLLTNDGELKRRLELPATGWLRKYRVRVNGMPADATFAPLRAGLVIGGERFKPMEVTLDRQQGANAWLTVGIREGRNREVRRAMEAVGLTVNRLIRISYGPFRLGELAAGAIEEVRQKVLRDQLGLAPARKASEPAGRAGPRTPGGGRKREDGPGAGKPESSRAGKPAPAGTPKTGRRGKAGAAAPQGGRAGTLPWKGAPTDGRKPPRSPRGGGPGGSPGGKRGGKRGGSPR